MSYQLAATLSEVPVGSAVAVDFGGEAAIAVVNTTDGLFAIRDLCSHADYPLSEGEVTGCALECYAHGSRFDLRTGRALDPPALGRVPVYPVRVEGDQILIDPDNPIQIRE